MSAVSMIKYEQDNASAYEFFGPVQGKLLFATKQVSKTTGTPKVPGPTRTFIVLTFSGKLSLTDWKALYDDLVAEDASDFDDTYPRVTYTYQSGSTIVFKCMCTEFSWRQIGSDRVTVSMTVEEYK